MDLCLRLIFKIIYFSLKIGAENGLYIHSEFVTDLENELQGRLRSSDETQNLSEYNPNLKKDNIIKLRDLLKGVFFITFLCYAIAIIVIIFEYFIISNFIHDWIRV